MTTPADPHATYTVQVREPEPGERFIEGATIGVATHDHVRTRYPVIVAEQPSLLDGAA